VQREKKRPTTPPTGWPRSRFVPLHLAWVGLENLDADLMLVPASPGPGVRPGFPGFSLADPLAACGARDDAPGLSRSAE
jgi:hypothetical protein